MLNRTPFGSIEQRQQPRRVPRRGDHLQHPPAEIERLPAEEMAGRLHRRNRRPLEIEPRGQRAEQSFGQAPAHPLRRNSFGKPLRLLRVDQDLRLTDEGVAAADVVPMGVADDQRYGQRRQLGHQCAEVADPHAGVKQHRPPLAFDQVGLDPLLVERLLDREDTRLGPRHPKPTLDELDLITHRHPSRRRRILSTQRIGRCRVNSAPHRARREDR